MTTASTVGTNETEMRECFSFRLILCGMDEITDEIEQKLWDAGCPDGMIGIHSGTPYIAFDREAQTLEAAIHSAIHQVEGAGLGIEVIRVVPPGEDTIAAINAFLRLRQRLKTKLIKFLPAEMQHKVDEILEAIAESDRDPLVHALDDQ